MGTGTLFFRRGIAVLPVLGLRGQRYPVPASNQSPDTTGSHPDRLSRTRRRGREPPLPRNRKTRDTPRQKVHDLRTFVCRSLSRCSDAPYRGKKRIILLLIRYPRPLRDNIARGNFHKPHILLLQQYNHSQIHSTR